MCLMEPTSITTIEAICARLSRRRPLVILVSDMLRFERRDPDRILFDREMLERAQRRARVELVN
jgi:hypothetical protein